MPIVLNWTSFLVQKSANKVAELRPFQLPKDIYINALTAQGVGTVRYFQPRSKENIPHSIQNI